MTTTVGGTMGGLAVVHGTRARRPVLVLLCALFAGSLLTSGAVADELEAPQVPASDEEGPFPEPGSLPPVEVDDTFFDLQWYLQATRTTPAWNLTRGAGVTVAVVDTGVDTTHQDLDDAFWRDPLRRVGRDLLNGGTDPFTSPEEDWHGTAVAGIVAARADDGYGIAGVAPEASIMVLKIYGSQDEATSPALEEGYDTAVDGIDAAVRLGADVILLTWGGLEPSFRLRNAIATAGVPVVVAAGNDGVDVSAADPEVVRYPAQYRLPNLVTVAASDRQSRRWIDEEQGIGTNVGARHVDLAAPGARIPAPWAGRGHRYHDGTSFAAPQVAGALALGRALAPRASASELVAELSRTARVVPAFAGRVTSGGILDVEAFVTAIQRPACGDPQVVAGFVDVAPDSTHARSIDCLVGFGLTTGTGDDRYSPSAPITRGQMATFIARTLARAGQIEDPAQLPAPVTPEEASFTDTADTTHAAAIEAVAAAGIALGYDDGTFRPGQVVDRGQMAAFLVRTHEQLTGEVVTAQRAWFDDVDGSTHEASILAARELAITLGTVEPRTYAPRVTLTRAQMASLLARTLDALVRDGVTLSPG